MYQVYTKFRCAETGGLERKVFVSATKQRAKAEMRAFYERVQPRWWSIETERSTVGKACTFNGLTSQERMAL